MKAHTGLLLWAEVSLGEDAPPTGVGAIPGIVWKVHVPCLGHSLGLRGDKKPRQKSQGSGAHAVSCRGLAPPLLGRPDAVKAVGK